jgi:hypothetical protein
MHMDSLLGIDELVAKYLFWRWKSRFKIYHKLITKRYDNQGDARKFNKVDSQKNRNILVPEIDLYLNEAEEIFVKLIAEPRKR